MSTRETPATERAATTPRGLSIERKLPLLVVTLLALVLIVALAIAGRELTRSAQLAAMSDLRRVTRELAASAEASTQLRARSIRQLGADSTVRRALAGETVAAPALRAALARHLPLADSSDAFQLWRADGRPTPLILDVASASPEGASRIPPRDDSAHYSPFYAASGRVFYWIVSPVVEGGRRLGWVAEERHLAATPADEQRIKGIVGPDILIFFRNTNTSLWTSLGGSLARPAVDARRDGDLTTRRRPDRGMERMLAAESPIRGTPWVVSLERPLSAAVASARAMVTRLAAGALLLLVVAAFVIWLISRRLTKPLVELTDATESMARGDLTASVSESYLARGDEIGRLAASFNRMAEQMSGARLELEEQLEEAQALGEELEEAASEARQARDTTRVSEERFRSLVEATTQVVWRTDAEGAAGDLPGWRRLTGQSPAEVKGFGFLDAVEADERARAQQAWRAAVASRRSLTTEWQLRLAGGGTRWFLVRAVPVFESLGAAGERVREWVGTCTDIDDRIRQESAARFLADASAALAQTLDMDATLATVAELAIAELADGCLVTLVADEESAVDGAFARDGAASGVVFRQVAVASRDPAKAALVRELDRRFPLPADAPSGYPSVIRTGRPEIVDPATFDERVLSAIAQSPEHRAMLEKLDMYAGMVVPLIARGRTLGAITFVRHGPSRRSPFDENDLRLAEELARRAALAMDNARAVRDAQRARRIAEAANQSKSEFLATMSHEIRTPLNAIIGYTQLMEMGIAGPVTSEQRTQLERVTSSGKHLLGLIDDILDLARIEAGRLRVGSAAGVASAAVDAALSLIRPQAAAKGIVMSSGCEGARDTTYQGDEQRVQQVLVNLLSNAVKFTPPGGRIRVSCGSAAQLPPEADATTEGPWAWFEVEDSGIGIAPELLQRIFQPFVQAEAGYTRAHSGTGLGLTISRRLARMMGGELTVESHQGEGSRFTLWLKALPVGAAASHAHETPASAAQAMHASREIEMAAGTVARTRSLATFGRALLENMSRIIDRFTARLRAASADLPNIGTLTDVQLQDHVAAWLADIAQSLVAVESVAGDPSELLRDSSEIQRLICERHGSQRHRLGWDEDALAREFRIIDAVIEETLTVRKLPPEDVARCRTVLAGMVRQAEQISLRGMRLAAHAEPVGQPKG